MPRLTAVQRKDLCNGPFLPKIITYTVPIIVTSILQLLFNAADLVIIGLFEGDNAVSAVGANGSLVSLIVSLFMGLSVGAGVRVAHGIGARNYMKVQKTVHTAIPLAALSGAFLTVAGVFLSPYLLEMMKTPPKVLPLATTYLQIYFGGIIPVIVFNFGAAILRSAGDTKRPMIYLVIAGVINVSLNLLFVAVFRWNVVGVAVATVISQAVSCFLVLRALMHREDACRLELSKIKLDGHAVRRIAQIGLPAGIQASLFAISNVLIQSSVNELGDVVLAGRTAAGNIEGFVYMSMNAFQQTATTFVGQNDGAGKYKNIRKILVLCLSCVAVVGLVMGVGAYLLSPWLLDIYLDQPDAIRIGTVGMAYVCAPYFLCGIMDVFSGTLRGMGYSVVPMFVSVVGVCVLRVVWVAAVFPFWHTFQSLMISYPISWIITNIALCSCYTFLRLRRVEPD